jgi:myo-inositol-1-phosphate synthase
MTVTAFKITPLYAAGEPPIVTMSQLLRTSLYYVTTFPLKIIGNRWVLMERIEYKKFNDFTERIELHCVLDYSYQAVGFLI